ncbi:MAG: hypothetical protein ABSH16_06735 [Sedimentisphaerales bacterium]
MKTAEKTLFLIILRKIFTFFLLFAAILPLRTEATTVADYNIIAGHGWDMGMCRVPTGPNTTSPVYFASGEIINMPLHINNLQDNPDLRDIYIIDTNGSPVFTEKVEMGESRYDPDGNDKYEEVMSCFQNGIDFDVPDSNITNEAAVQDMIDSFRDSTAAAYRFDAGTAASIIGGSKCTAVQIEFYVSGDVGMVRIDPNCTVVLHSPRTYDYNIVWGSDPMSFQKYNIYAYHYRKNSDPCIIVPITDTYVTQNFGSYTSEPAGQIFVNGNVVIGGGEDANFTDINNMVVNGKIFVVATGNIWVADSIIVNGAHDENGIPTADNPNIIELITKGVIKIVDPGLSPISPPAYSGYVYRPIGIIKPGSSGRYLPNPTIIEAGITVGGGGWGAENVGKRGVYNPPQDTLILHGAISEVLRGVVGLINTNGYAKKYNYDRRLNPPPNEHGHFIGDLNGDCALDFNDAAILAGHWLENHLSGDNPPVCTSPVTGDLNFDCVVDFIDFAIQAQHWLGNDICF